VTAPHLAPDLPPPPVDRVGRLVADRFASRTARAVRLRGLPWWAALPHTSRSGTSAGGLVRRPDHVLCVTAGSAGTAAELVAGPQAPLTVLDTTDPGAVASALAGDLAAAGLVVSAPPGTDTAAVERMWAAAERALGRHHLDPGAVTVVVTPRDGPLAPRARAVGADVVEVAPLREPYIPEWTPKGSPLAGPWTALSPYALVPARTAGVDVTAVLDDAVAAAAAFADDDPANPALRLAALLADDGSVIAFAATDPLSEWAAGLVAAGLGQARRGPVPVVVEAPGAPGWDEADLRVDPGACGGPIGARIALWQHAVAAAASLLEVDPGEAPIPAGTAPPPLWEGGQEGAVAILTGPGLPGGSVAAALRGLLHPAVDRLAVHAYLDRAGDAAAAALRPPLARRTGLPTSFGWAPRCLTGTAQQVRDGTGRPAVLQLTGAPPASAAGLKPGLARVQREQADADAAALLARGRPVLRLHLTDRAAGLATVARAVHDLPGRDTAAKGEQ
jgi:glucose-6-phosphate isomerase